MAVVVGGRAGTWATADPRRRYRVCAARKAARNVRANGITYIRFYRKTARRKTTKTETIQSGVNLTSKTIANEDFATRDMFDMWDMLICT